MSIASAEGLEPAVDPTEAERALARALDLPRVGERAATLAAWLRAHPAHPRSEEALRAWRDARRRAPLATLQLATEGRAYARFIGPDRVIAWVNTGPGVWIADPWTGVVERQWEDLRLHAVASDPRGGVLVAVDGKRLRRLPPNGADLVDDLWLPHRARVQALAVTETRIAVLQQQVARVLDREGGHLVREIGPIDAAPKELALADGGRVLVVASGPNVYDEDPSAMAVVRSFDLSNGELLVEQRTGDRTSFVGPGPDGRFVAGTTTGVLAMFDPRGERLVQFTSEQAERGFAGGLLVGVAHDACLRDGLLVDGGRRLLTVGGDYSERRRGDLRCWDTATGEEVAPAVRWPKGACTIDLSPDGRVVVVGLEAGTIELWAAPHRELELEIEPVPVTGEGREER